MNAFTEWFNGHNVVPGTVGAYQVHTGYFAYWNGRHWGGRRTIDAVYDVRDIHTHDQTPIWRGLVTQHKEK